MPQVNELYQEIIIDHNEHPLNEGVLADATHRAKAYNSSCGDELDVSLKIHNGCIVDVRFQAQGCAISRASGSMMTEFIKGMKAEDAKRFSSEMQRWLNGSDATIDPQKLGDLQALLGVKQFPMRVKCATLAWHTLDDALDRLIEKSA